MNRLLPYSAFWMVIFFHLPVALAADPPQKVAFLVGVSKYDKHPFNNLNYPESDVQSLASELKKEGFQTKVMLGSNTGAERPTRKNLQSGLMEDFVAKLGALNKQDIALIILSGHGMQAMRSRDSKQVEDSFYCPVDAQDANLDSLLSISDLMDEMCKSGADSNLLVVDACRDNGSKGVDGRGIVITRTNLGVLLAASPGTVAYESTKLHGGFLAYCLLEGLQGKAANGDGDITWDGLVTYVRDKVPSYAENENKNQTPCLISSMQGRPAIFCRAASRVSIKPELLTAPFSKEQAQAAQVAWAKFQGKPNEFTNRIGMHMQLVPAGEFDMGSSEALPADDQTPHRVRITRPFYVDIHETTVGEFKAFVAATKYRTTVEKAKDTSRRGWLSDSKRFGQSPAGFNWKNPGWKQSDDHPVVNVTWYDAQEFVKWLSQREGRTYRLLTEAEWEYCCRAGTTTKYYPGENPIDLPSVGNVLDKTGMATFKTDRAFVASNQDLAINGNDHYAFTAPVGSYPKNAFGLHDMHGNVCEWCSDYYGIGYQNYVADDPVGATSGAERSARGGRFDTGEELAKSYYRNHGAPDMCDMILGIRVAAELGP